MYYLCNYTYIIQLLFYTRSTVREKLEYISVFFFKEFTLGNVSKYTIIKWGFYGYLTLLLKKIGSEKIMKG